MHSDDEIPIRTSNVLHDVEEHDSEYETDPEEELDPEEGMFEENESDPEEEIDPEEVMLEENESDPEEEIDPEEPIIEENESDPEEEIDPEEPIVEENESNPKVEIDPEIVMNKENESDREEENETDPEEDLDPEEQIIPEEVMVEEKESDPEEQINPKEVMVEENESDPEEDPEEEIDREIVMVEENESDPEEDLDPEEETIPEEVMVEENESDPEEDLDPEEVLDEENTVMEHEVESEPDRKDVVHKEVSVDNETESISNEKSIEYLRESSDENKIEQKEKDPKEDTFKFGEGRVSFSNDHSRVDKETPKNEDVIEKNSKNLEFVDGELDKKAKQVSHAVTKVELKATVPEPEPVLESKRKRQKRKKKQVMTLSEEHEKKKQLVDDKNIKSRIYSQGKEGPKKSFKKIKKKKYKFGRGEPLSGNESTTKYSSKQLDEHIAECSSRRHRELPSGNSSSVSSVGHSGQVEPFPPRPSMTPWSSKRLYSTLESTPNSFGHTQVTQVRQDYESCYERAPQRARPSYEIYERTQPRGWLNYQAESTARFPDTCLYRSQTARLDYNISQRQHQPRRFPDYGIPRTNLRYDTAYSYRPEQSQLQSQSQSHPGYARGSHIIQDRHDMVYNGRSFYNAYDRTLSQSYARQYNDHVVGRSDVSSRYPIDRSYSRLYD